MNFKSIVVFFGALVLTAVTASGRLASLRKKVPDLLERADLVVKGEIVEIKSLGRAVLKADDPLRSERLKPFAPEEMSATILIDRVLKGNVAGKKMDFRFLQSQKGAFTPFSKKDYALIFLKSRGGKLELIDVDNGKLRAKRVNRATTSEKGAPALVQEFAAMAEDSDSETASEGLNALRQFTSQDAQRIMRNHLTDKRIGVRAQAIAGLIENGDSEAAKVMVRELKTERMRKRSAGREEQGARNAFVESLIHMRADKKNAVHAAELVDHEDPFIRNAAVDVLRMTHSTESIPTLVKLLDSPDAHTQYAAVITLCEIARPNGHGCPSGILFERKRDEYLAEWKAWAANNKK